MDFVLMSAGAPFGSFGLKRALARTEEFLVLKTERNRLVDQVRPTLLSLQRLHVVVVVVVVVVN